MKISILTNFTIVNILLIIIYGCGTNTKESGTNLNLNDHKVTVKEAIQATSYSYLKVEEGSETYWIAITKTDFGAGDVLYYDEGLEMANFESKDLKRTFEKILFVQNISDQPTLPGEQLPMTNTKPQKPTLEKQNIQIETAEDGISIATLYSNRTKYRDQTVKIRGQVTKVNQNIMGKNWIHVQDGTESEGNFDLTITTDQLVNIGEIVTFEGKIALDKDFGAGYTYTVIMEEAVLINPI
jgi:hypothetical protein